MDIKSYTDTHACIRAYVYNLHNGKEDEERCLVSLQPVRHATLPPHWATSCRRQRPY
jgi:hypothetical protein